MNMIKIALLGAGTVGGGVIKVLEKNSADICKKTGEQIQLVKIFGQTKDMEHYKKEYGSNYTYTDKIEDILEDEEIKIVVELIGREHPAKEFIEDALRHGKSVVTANKDVVAKYGKELFHIAEENGCDLLFEASVAGGIPIITPLKTSLAANEIQTVMGIVNSTTNYMLTKMTREGMDYNDVLKEAQAKGYAESDPTADVGGLDAARKIVILGSIAFNTRLNLDDVAIEGIEKISIKDIQFAQELGYVIKLLAVAKRDPKHGISVAVHPTMLPKDHPLANVNDVYNAIFVVGDAVGDTMFMGMGAGRFPTASAVCSDIMEAARNMKNKDSGRISCTCFNEKKLCPKEHMFAPCYIRMQVTDEPGALSAIAAAFASQNVSLRNVVQKDLPGQSAEIVVITHRVSEMNLEMALNLLKVLPVVAEINSVIRVEDKEMD
ncbi:MAG: homoserine dehydrogenase [Acidaminococcaceae bacterium]|nr:homoserine dehydrogenase [Acidaminococcaceae bacterium]